MKRFLLLMLAFLLIVPCALALGMEGIPDSNRAAVAQNTALFAEPDERAQVLMEYFSGTRVEVIREADAQYVQVNVGRKGGSLMGYMDKDDLVFGEAAIRENRPMEVCYRHTGWPLHSYCDVQSALLAQSMESYCCAIGEYKDWMHVKLQTAEGEITGFVKKRDTPDWGRIRTSFDYAAQIRTIPTGDEPTEQEAIDYAKARLVADGVPCNAQDGEIVTLERLDRCRAEAEMFYTYDATDASPLWYLVTFYYDDRTWEDGSEMICALACLYVEGGEFIAYDYGKG